MNISVNDEVLARVYDGLECWNRGDIGRLLSHYSEDVALSSPYVVSQPGKSAWLQGREEVAEHKLAMRSKLPNIELIEVLSGAGFVTLLLNSGGRLFTMMLEPDDEARARRIIICHGQDKTGAAGVAASDLLAARDLAAPAV